VKVLLRTKTTTFRLTMARAWQTIGSSSSISRSGASPRRVNRRKDKHPRNPGHRFIGKQPLRSLPAPRKLRGGEGLTFRGVSLYPDGVVVSYDLRPESGFDPNAAFERFLSILPREASEKMAAEAMMQARENLDMLAILALWIEDDLGTTYSYAFEGHGSGIDRIEWQLAFVPAVPDDARLLELHGDFEAGAIDLQS
jgi:hypothetical protein